MNPNAGIIITMNSKNTHVILMEVISSSDLVGKPINRLLIEAKYGSNKAKISTKNHVKLFAAIPILSKISMVLDAEIKIGRFDK